MAISENVNSAIDRISNMEILQQVNKDAEMLKTIFKTRIGIFLTCYANNIEDRKCPSLIISRSGMEKVPQHCLHLQYRNS